MPEKLVSSLCQRKSVVKRLFDSKLSSSIGDGGSDAQFTRTPSQPPQLQLLTPKTARK